MSLRAQLESSTAALNMADTVSSDGGETIVPEIDIAKIEAQVTKRTKDKESRTDKNTDDHFCSLFFCLFLFVFFAFFLWNAATST